MDGAFATLDDGSKVRLKRLQRVPSAPPASAPTRPDGLTAPEDDTKEPRVLAKKKVARARRVVEQREGVAFDFGKKALRERLPAVGLVSDRYGAIRI